MMVGNWYEVGRCLDDTKVCRVEVRSLVVGVMLASASLPFVIGIFSSSGPMDKQHLCIFLGASLFGLLKRDGVWWTWSGWVGRSRVHHVFYGISKYVSTLVIFHDASSARGSGYYTPACIDRIVHKARVKSADLLVLRLFIKRTLTS
jgi:hypothetical protein